MSPEEIALVGERYKAMRADDDVRALLLRVRNYYEDTLDTESAFQMLAQALLAERRKGREEGLEEALVILHNYGVGWAVIEEINRLKDKQP